MSNRFKKKLHALTREQKRGIIILVAVLVASGLIVWFAGRPMIAFVSEPKKFRNWVAAHRTVGWLVYMGMTILQVVIAVIPGEPLEIAAGYAFGAIEGTILCVVATTLGAMIVFFLVRKFGMRLVRLFFSEEKLHSVKFLQDSKKRDFLFLILMIIPGTPKDILCYIAGLTNMSALKWLLICSIPRLPSIVTSTIGGNALGEGNYFFALLFFLGVLIISLLGLWAYNRLARQHKDR